MVTGLNHLASWRDSFIAGVLPPRPKGFMWSQGICADCDYKKEACKPDDKAGVTKLVDSTGHDFAREIRPGYDPARIRQAVLDRWGADDRSE